jgi:hypothetical protein
LTRIITATIVVVLIVAGLVLSFQVELGRPLLIFAGGICVLDALARWFKRDERANPSTDLATWTLAGLLAMFAGIAWNDIGQIPRDIVVAVISLLLILGYRGVVLTARG